MEKYKVNSSDDNRFFLITDCYRKLYDILKGLKKSRGKIIHVVGAPGTGKSANIYRALNDLDLNVYDVKFSLKSLDSSSKQVFNRLFECLSIDIGLKSKEEIYEALSNYDVVLIADSFHDSHALNPNHIGFSKWTNHAGFKTFYFYLMCIAEYTKYRKYFKNMNILLQTAWRFYMRGKKYDIFTDLGLFSKILVNILKIFFDVVVIQYSEIETINIVRMYIDADMGVIKKYIQKYGRKPRFICDALEK